MVSYASCVLACTCDCHPTGTVVIVAHGTVITLFVTRRTKEAPFPFWRRPGLPSFVVLALPDMAVREIADQIDMI